MTGNESTAPRLGFAGEGGAKRHNSAPGDETHVTIKGRPLTLSVDGLGPLEITTIANQVAKKIEEIEKKTQIPDTSKLALMAAFDFATDLYNLKQKSETSREADSRKIEELVEKLESSLDKRLF